MLKVGDCTTPGIFNPLAIPLTKVVLPAPKSPVKVITLPEGKKLANLLAMFIVSSFEFEITLTSSIKKLINEKIALSLRPTLHFLEDEEGTIFAENIGIAERVAPDGNTSKYLMISVERS